MNRHAVLHSNSESKILTQQGMTTSQDFEFFEDYHAVGLRISIDNASGRFEGTYDPKWKSAVRLTGTLVDAAAGKYRGRWEDIDASGSVNPLETKGTFELTRKKGNLEGWWSFSNSTEKRPWNWYKVEQEQASLTINEEDLEPIKAFGDARTSKSSSLSVWLTDTVNSRTMSKYGLLTAVLCAVFTSFQTYMTVDAYLFLKVDPELSKSANFLFNVAYSLMYLSFLVAYVYMHTRPHPIYIAGVALYTAGYMTYVVYFGLPATLTYTLWWLNILGSSLFTSGSIALVYTTVPSKHLTLCPNSPSSDGKIELNGESEPGACLCGKEASLLWGSLMFLLGSVEFLSTATYIQDPILARNFNITAYVAFLLGRFYFVQGSVPEPLVEGEEDAPRIVQGLVHGGRYLAATPRTSQRNHYTIRAAAGVASSENLNLSRVSKEDPECALGEPESDMQQQQHTA